MPEKAHAVDKSPTKRISGHARGNYQCHPLSEQRARCGAPGGDGSADHLTLALRVADHNARRLSRSATCTDSTAAAGDRA
jgi:hypothetical protein